MTTMHATAIITAVDRASAVFNRVGAAAAAQAGRFQAAFGAANKFAGTAGTVMGAGGLLAASMSVDGEKQLDYITRLMQSAGELSAFQRDALKTSALDASVKTGVKALELVEAQRELIQGGIDADTSMSMTETFAKVARANGIEAKKVAEDAINVSNALGFAMGNTEEKVASLRRTMSFMSVVPSLSTESWEGLRTSLKYAAPVAGDLKIPISELGAALSILADAGFKAEEGGTALRTILVRALSPTRQARLEMRAMGVDLEKLYRFDPAKLGNMQSLAERIRGAGLGQGVDLDKQLAPLRDPSKFEGIYSWQDKAQEILSKSLGIKKGDAEARGILNKVIGGHINAASSGFDLEKYFKGISKLPLQALKELFGLQRISQATKLRDKINEVLELPSGERVSRLRYLADEFDRLMPGSIDRRAEPVLEGFAAAVDKAMAALTRLRSAIFDSGIGAGLSDALGKAATAVERFSRTNPQALRDITLALGGLALLGPAAWALRSTAAGLAMISTSVARLGASRLLLGGGLGALLLGDMGKLFDTVTYDPFGQAISPYDQLRTSIVGFVSETLGALGDLSNAVTKAYNAVRELFGFGGGSSLLLDGIRLVVSALELGSAQIKFWRENLPTLFSFKDTPTAEKPGDKPVGSLDDELGAVANMHRRQKAHPVDAPDMPPQQSWWQRKWDEYPKPASLEPGQEPPRLKLFSLPRDDGQWDRVLGDIDARMRALTLPRQTQPDQIGGREGVQSPVLPSPEPPRFIGDMRSAEPQRVDVQGQADVKVQNEITVRVEGPGTVVDQRGGQGEAKVPLNTGKTMPDTGVR